MMKILNVVQIIRRKLIEKTNNRPFNEDIFNKRLNKIIFLIEENDCFIDTLFFIICKQFRFKAAIVIEFFMI
jgi:hypothetical protein